MSSAPVEVFRMKGFRHAFALIIVSSFAACAVAQTEGTEGKAQENLKALTILRHDLRVAATSMQPCMPIYEGHCGSAKNAVHEAQLIVSAAIAAATPPTPVPPTAVAAPAAKEAAPTAKPPVAAPSTKKADPPKAPAPTATKPAAKAEATSEQPKQTEEQKIAKSQAHLRKGLEAIQLAIKDLKTAAGALSDADAIKLEKVLAAAEAEATKSIALHANQG